MGIPPTIQFASLGMADSLILMVLALVVFGPRRLPQIGRQIGKLMYEFRKASNDFKFQMEEELRNAEEGDRRKAEEERLKALALAAPAQSVEVTPVANGEAAVASPYPGEIEYPAGAMAAADEIPIEEPYPRIQPPSTGEQVQAANPSTPAAGLDVAPAAIPEAGAAKEQAQEQQPAPATEPIAHHG
jgi:sec-independent protein translocase protein TatB